MQDNIKNLEDKIIQAKKAYYNSGNPIMSDEEYDFLEEELSKLDPDNKILNSVGTDAVSEWKKVKHQIFLGSLNKVNTPEGMEKWIYEVLENRETVLMWKLDGLSLALVYENGVLISGATRGAGVEGEDIYQNVIKMKGAVKNLSDKFTGTIRGEIVLTKKDHQEYFKGYSNPRNTASGVARRFDGEGVEHLTLMCYNVIGDIDFETELSKLDWLRKNKFITPDYKLCASVKEVNDLWRSYQDTIRETLELDIDGLVVVCNEVSFQENLGWSSGRPKGAKAFKFSNQFVETGVVKIDWNTGSMGRVAPLCWVNPVNLLGSIVSKASVYNVAYVKKLGLGIGARVLICKAGEVIPKIESVVIPADKVETIPTHCTSCNSELKMQGEYLMCLNSLECPEQKLGRLKNWIATLNVLEWGEQLLIKLVEASKVSNIADLYKLSVKDLEALERMGAKSALNCYMTLHAKKELPLDDFIGGLSIPLVGSTMTKVLMENGYDTIDKLFAGTKEQFVSIKGFGPEKAESLYNGLRKNKQLIEGLMFLGITVKEKVKKVAVEGGKLSNLSVCITGKTDIKRKDLQKMIEDNGGTFVDKANKDCNILVIADPDSSSSKAVSARKLGIKLISEDQFLDMVK